MTAKGKGPQQMLRNEIKGLKAQITRRDHRIEELEQQLEEMKTEETNYLTQRMSEETIRATRAELRVEALQDEVSWLKNHINVLGQAMTSATHCSAQQGESLNDKEHARVFHEGSKSGRRIMERMMSDRRANRVEAGESDDNSTEGT